MTQPSIPHPSLETLRQQLRRLESAHRQEGERFSSGCSALDRLVDFRRGTLIDYLADAGSGAAALALIAAREAGRDGGELVVIDRQFYPQAACSLGIDLTNVIIVRPRTQKDELWALNQSLSCKGVAAVLCWADKLGDRVYRGLQLAAETSGAVGLLIRPAEVRGHPTWSDVQLLVETMPAIAANRRLRIEVVRCRSGQVGKTVELELNDETGTLQKSHPMPLAPAMALTAIAASTARA
jgi:protein ImuA